MITHLSPFRTTHSLVSSQAMDIIRMTCVKYDHVFANDIEAKLPNFETLLAASSQKKAALLGNRAPLASVARLTPDVESEDEEQGQGQGQEKRQDQEQEQEIKQDQEREQEIKQEPSKELEPPRAYSEPPADLDFSPRQPRVASQEVLRRIGEGLIQDFGVEDSDSDYVEDSQ